MVGSGTTPTNWADGSVCTIDTIKAAMDRVKEIPAPPVLASSIMFPSDMAMKFEHDGQEFVLAGPAFWAKFPKTELQSTSANPLFQLRIVDVDHPAERATRIRVFGAMAALASAAEGQQPGSGG